MQEPLLNVLPVVADPSPPESLANPQPFLIEFGRNKPGEEGRNIFVRNEFYMANWTNHPSYIDWYIGQNPGWGLYSAAFQYYFTDHKDFGNILLLGQNLKKQQDKHKRQIIKNEIQRVFSTAYLRGDFFLDFDHEEDISKAQQDAYHIFQHLIHSPKYKIPPNMIRVYFSGKKGIHIIVPRECFGIEWHPHLDRVYKVMAKELNDHFAPNKTLDMQVYERRRLFRLAGSQHPSTGSYKVPMELKYLLGKKEHDIQHLSKDKRYGAWIQYEEPRVILEAQKHFQLSDQSLVQSYGGTYKMTYSQQGEQATLDFVPPCFQLMLEKGPVDGTRNAVGSMLSSFWRQRGLTEQEAWDNLVDWNNEILPEWELKTLFESNFNGPYVYKCNKIKERAECPATCKADCKFWKA